MAIERCDYCDQNIDLDLDIEHWSEDEYSKGRDKWKCRWEIEDDDQFRVESWIKRQKESPMIKRTDPDTGRDRR